MNAGKYCQILQDGLVEIGNSTGWGSPSGSQVKVSSGQSVDQKILTPDSRKPVQKIMIFLHLWEDPGVDCTCTHK